jgi:hypothetical protein
VPACGVMFLCPASLGFPPAIIKAGYLHISQQQFSFLASVLQQLDSCGCCLQTPSPASSGMWPCLLLGFYFVSGLWRFLSCFWTQLCYFGFLSVVLYYSHLFFLRGWGEGGRERDASEFTLSTGNFNSIILQWKALREGILLRFNPSVCAYLFIFCFIP